MCSCNRRIVLSGLLVLPIGLAGCRKQTEGPEAIHYGREVCAMCGMIISDPHYAAEIRGGPNAALVKFDDIGDAVNWLEMQSWRSTGLLEFWVMDSENGKDWLDARSAYYQPGVVSPMDYGFAALKSPRGDAVDFAVMSKAALTKGLSSRCPPPSSAQGT